MKSPIQLFIQLPDGREYPIESIAFARDGTVRHVATFVTDGRPVGLWYDIDKAYLDRCRLVARAPGIEYWSERPDETTPEQEAP